MKVPITSLFIKEGSHPHSEGSITSLFIKEGSKSIEGRYTQWFQLVFKLSFRFFSQEKEGLGNDEIGDLKCNTPMSLTC